MKYFNNFLLITLLCSSCIFSTSTNAQSTTTDINILTARNVVLDGQLQAKLRSILNQQDFNNFNSNLDEFSVPYTLKSGATYYEATRDSLNSGSALVVTPEGYYYIAYKMPNSNQIIYVTNDTTCNKEPHDAIKIFANKFSNNPTIVKSNSIAEKTSIHSCNTVYGNQEVKKNIITRSMTSYANGESSAQQMTRKSAESIWGATTTNQWNMNNELAEVVGKAVNQIRTCSANFNLVPKPPAYGSVVGLAYFAKYGAQVVKYNAGLTKNRSYQACISNAARTYRSSAEMASAGI